MAGARGDVRGAGAGEGPIAVLLHDLPLGGSERIAVRLANAWAELGRPVVLYCGDAEGPLRALVSPAVEVVAADPPIRRGRGSRRRLGRAFAAFVAQRTPSLVFAPGNYQWPALPPLYGLRADERPPIVAQIGTPLYRRGRGRLAQVEYNWRTRRRLRGVAAAVSLSHDMTSDADRVLGRRITTRIPLPALAADAPPPVAAAPDGRLILCAGRLVKVKGFDVALRAFAAMGDAEARLAIVGEGPELPRLQALAAELGVAGRVEFAGYAPDIRPWLDRCRLLVLSSWYEGYAAVVVEALAAGRPVVATDCTPAARELLGDRRCGRIVPPGDVAALAAAVGEVLAAPAPEPHALARTVAGFEIGAVARDYLHIFDRVRRERRPASEPARPVFAALRTAP